MLRLAGHGHGRSVVILHGQIYCDITEAKKVRLGPNGPSPENWEAGKFLL